MLEYIINSSIDIVYKGETILDANDVVQAIKFANTALRKLDESTKDLDINIFETLGLRNLSGLVGEFFARSVMRVSQGKLHSNLHQDGYPDLLLINTPERKSYFDTLYIVENGKLYPKEKEKFSPYLYGGIEVKACCGSTPSASQVRKPLIGEQRIGLITSFDWKAHHRDTNHLLAILWDFIEGFPTVVAAFFQDTLTQDDWGNIVEPHKGGGRTTSVSIMKAKGVKKMCSHWIAVIDDEAYIDKLSNRKWIGKRIDEII